MNSHSLLVLRVKGLKGNIFSNSYALIPNIPKIASSLGGVHSLFTSSELRESSARRIQYNFSFTRRLSGWSLDSCSKNAEGKNEVSNCLAMQ